MGQSGLTVISRGKEINEESLNFILSNAKKLFGIFKGYFIELFNIRITEKNQLHKHFYSYYNTEK